jgi:hypothetical protein
MFNFSIAITSSTPFKITLCLALAAHQYLQSHSSSFLQVLMSSDLKQASPDRNGYRMGPIVGPELIHEILDVEIDRGLRDGQFIGNLFVAMAVSNESKDFQFSRRKIVVA